MSFGVCTRVSQLSRLVTLPSKFDLAEHAVVENADLPLEFRVSLS